MGFVRHDKVPFASICFKIGADLKFMKDYQKSYGARDSGDSGADDQRAIKNSDSRMCRVRKMSPPRLS
jgi:hypothetical protein